MASTSTALATQVRAFNHGANDDLDVETALLIARLALEDIESVEGSSKGKGRADALPSDEALALQLQAEYSSDYCRLIEDYRLAQSLHNALRTDSDFLDVIAIVEQGAHDDHQAAIALSRGLALPPPSRSQRSLEDPLLSLEPPLVDSQADENATLNSDETVVDSDDDDQLVTTEVSSSQTKHRDKTRSTCISCMENVGPLSAFRAPCTHYYCRTCLTDLVETCTRDESLFPLRCCNQNFIVADILYRVGFSLARRFQEKSREFSTPAPHRVYCPSDLCSMFLGSSENIGDEVNCVECWTRVCTRCKSVAHPGKPCGEDTALLEVQKLAQDEGWQRCPGCKVIIELAQGCFHMTCTCRTQFCYLCAAPWKTCPCPQWDEARLIVTARERVVNEFGARAAVAAPLEYEGRVNERIAALRVNHDCQMHTWRYRHGGGWCNQCNYTLPSFLMRCTGCQILACKRCSLNRF